MDWLGPLIETYGVGAVITLVFVFAVWKMVNSNAAVNVAAGKQITAVLELAATSQEMMGNALNTIKDNTAAVELAVTQLAANNEKHLEELGDALNKAANNATVERIANSRHLDEQFATVISQLETIQQAVNGGVTLTDFRTLSDELRTMITDVKTSLIEIKVAINAPSTI